METARSTLRFEETAGKITCLVTQPDDNCIYLQLRDDAKGQDLLDTVCDRLGIVEADYFGFQFTNNRGEIFWLNMRNRITRQVHKTEPYSFLFCVKFYIQPHQLLQNSTRRQFFLNVKRDLDAGKFKPDKIQSVRIQALIAQARDGDFRENHIAYNPTRTESWPCEYRREVIMEHCRLRGMPIESAEYRCLAEISNLEDYGVEYHHARSEENRPIIIGVGFEFLKITKPQENVAERIPYSCLHMATHNAKCVKLDIYTNEQGDMETILYRMNSKESACALYRSITEHHAFFRCDSIGTAVKEQVSKDFFDTFRNLFNDEHTAEQNYIFDITRTCKEAYDHARRVLFNFGSSTVRSMSNDVIEDSSEEKEERLSKSYDQEYKDKLDELRESFLCRVCRDQRISTVIQCGHMVCCAECVKHCSNCPLCRAEIKTVVPCYLPVNLEDEG